jgi:hypothetical protein
MSKIENLTINVTKAVATASVIIGGLVTGLTSYYATTTAIKNEIQEIKKQQAVFESQYSNLLSQIKDNKDNTTTLTNRFNEYIRPDEIKPRKYNR